MTCLTWNNFNLSSVSSSDIYLRAISQGIHQRSNTKHSLEITYLKSHSYIPEAYGFTRFSAWYNQWLRWLWTHKGHLAFGPRSEPCGVYCGSFGENWPSENETPIYHTYVIKHIQWSTFRLRCTTKYINTYILIHLKCIHVQWDVAEWSKLMIKT